jgi:hypothetical protein
MGAIIATPPDIVPNRAVINMVAIIIPNIARFFVLMPMKCKIPYTMVCATFVSNSTIPSPLPSIMINPTTARGVLSELRISVPIPNIPW